jgi:hypothetical protein
MLAIILPINYSIILPHPRVQQYLLIYSHRWPYTDIRPYTNTALIIITHIWPQHLFLQCIMFVHSFRHFWSYQQSPCTFFRWDERYAEWFGRKWGGFCDALIIDKCMVYGVITTHSPPPHADNFLSNFKQLGLIKFGGLLFHSGKQNRSSSWIPFGCREWCSVPKLLWKLFQSQDLECWSGNQGHIVIHLDYVKHIVSVTNGLILFLVLISCF